MYKKIAFTLVGLTLLATPLVSSAAIALPTLPDNPTIQDLLQEIILLEQILQQLLTQHNDNHLTASPSSGQAPLSVTFTWSDAAGVAVDFGDGQQTTLVGVTGCAMYGPGPSDAQGNLPPLPPCQSQFTTSHTYTSPGTYTARLSENSSCPSGAPCQARPVLGTATITVGTGPVCMPYFPICPTGSHSGGTCNRQCIPDGIDSGSITVTSVDAVPPGRVVNIQFSNLPAGWNIRIIGVSGPAQELPVTSTSLLAVPGSYTGNSVSDDTVPNAVSPYSATATVTVPQSAPSGSYVVEVSDPSSGWLTKLRTPAFYIGTPAGGITVTAPNGGEQWQEGVINTVTWTPYNYNPDINPSRDVTAYLERESQKDGTFTTIGKVQESGKASIHWITGELNSATQGGVYAPSAEGYYIRVVNNVTGAWDRSDAPFTLLPKPVDLKINGSDGPLTTTYGQALTATWTANGPYISCRLDNAYIDPAGNTYPVPQFQNLSTSGSAQIYVPAQGNWYVNLSCQRNDGSWQYDSVVTNQAPQPASLQVLNPNGGEQIDPTQPMIVRFAPRGLSTLAIALYKNDQWKYWITKEFVPTGKDADIVTWIPSAAGQALGTGDNAGAIWKIYITGQRADGQGYVDDKSDAPFSFTSAAPPPPPPPPVVGSCTHYPPVGFVKIDPTPVTISTTGGASACQAWCAAQDAPIGITGGCVYQDSSGTQTITTASSGGASAADRNANLANALTALESALTALLTALGR